MRIYPAIKVTDGAGVKLRRYIGTSYLRELDPFLLLDEFKSSDPEDYTAGFPEHPHRGFQTLTYMIRGRFKHRDSTGAEGVLEDGWLQWMNAGRGVIHSEMPLMKEGLLWGFQLWLNNPKEKKLSEPFYFNFRAREIVRAEGIRVLDLVGEPYRERGFYPLTYLHVELEEGKEYAIELPPENNTFIALSEGRLYLKGTEVKPESVAVFKGGVEVIALEKSVFLLGSAKPLGEPIARYGPFVMNTPEEIEEAIRDYREGLFSSR
ncbi:hypothetical protein BCF55_0121 [Hydrogenivirga caldilitoris]|uniref:Pirin family protein n=1 Tax=Hydrogenivirga caldilitoris TaxID=246264 RepID=A0A497XNI3_9AQUI|nr:pirin family protein [Hydrogenivirga caldilitoris]RLJ69864.1 hypothetical protein BCF55_0121 [Hydrogenivirga caldilitoris]